MAWEEAFGRCAPGENSETRRGRDAIDQVLLVPRGERGGWWWCWRRVDRGLVPEESEAPHNCCQQGRPQRGASRRPAGAGGGWVGDAWRRESDDEKLASEVWMIFFGLDGFLWIVTFVR